MKAAKRVCSGLIILVFVMGLLGCSASGSTGSASSGATEITFWNPFSGPDGPKMKEMVDEFNASQDKYVVNMEIKPNEDYYKALDLTIFDKENVPDLFIAHATHLPAYAEKGILKDLSSVVGEQVNKEHYNANAWEGAMYKGTLYGVPLDIHPLIMFWNKDLFEAAGLDPNTPPKNREEFLEFAKKLTDESKGQYGYVVPTGGLQNFIFPTLVYQNGGELITEDGEINYTSDAVVDAAQFQHDLIYDLKVSPSDVESPTQLFLQQKAAMILNGPWMINQFKESGVNFASAPIPQLGTEKQVVYGNSHNFVIPQSLEDEEKIAGIKEFLSYVSEHSLAWAEAGQAPASKAVYTSDEFQALEHQANVAKQFDYVQFPPEVPNWDQIANPLFEELNLVLLDEKGAEQAMEDAAKESKQKMNE